jgi:CRP-like cAMP-binding protein
MKNFLNKYDFNSELILNELKEEELKVVESYMEAVTFKAGKMLFYEDGIPTGVFLLKNGKAKIYKTGLDGKEQIFYIYREGDLLGYHALLCDERYEDSCESLEYCETLFISASNFNHLLSEIPSLKLALIKNMSHEFGVLVNTITVLAQKPLRERFALYLLILNNRFNRDGINLSREDFANLIGTTRESLGKMIKEFREEKLIELDKRVIAIAQQKKVFEISNSI